MLELDRIFNIYVDKHYRCDDPPRDIEQALNDWREPRDQCAGLLTAVRLEHTSIQEYTSDEFGLLCCTTAGVSNAARAGRRERYLMRREIKRCLPAWSSLLLQHGI